jgi:phosphoenolpyruvate---glycerone phosphotransferase subunit DhaL
MTERLDATGTVAMLRAVAEHVLASTEHLTRADQTIGDGDHGIGMARGFEAAKTKLAAEQPSTVDSAFRAVGMAIMASTGGAAGAVFGTMFVAAGNACKGNEVLDAAVMAEAMQAGLAAIQKRGGAKPGDKTMLDALAPAVEALQANKAGSLVVALAAAADAARGGVEATRDIVAVTGKARPLGARSIGHPDPGAITTSLIFEAMANYTRKAEV